MLTYTLDVRLDPALNVLLHNTVEQTAEAQVDASQDEVSTQNNAATDSNQIFKVIFRDGFEDQPESRRGPQASIAPPGSSPCHVFPLPDAALPSLPARASVRRAMRRPEVLA